MMRLVSLLATPLLLLLFSPRSSAEFPPKCPASKGRYAAKMAEYQTDTRCSGGSTVALTPETGAATFGTPLQCRAACEQTVGFLTQVTRKGKQLDDNWCCHYQSGSKQCMWSTSDGTSGGSSGYSAWKYKKDEWGPDTSVCLKCHQWDYEKAAFVGQVEDRCGVCGGDGTSCPLAYCSLSLPPPIYAGNATAAARRALLVRRQGTSAGTSAGTRSGLGSGLGSGTAPRSRSGSRGARVRRRLCANKKWAWVGPAGTGNDGWCNNNCGGGYCPSGSCRCTYVAPPVAPAKPAAPTTPAKAPNDKNLRKWNIMGGTCGSAWAAKPNQVPEGTTCTIRCAKGYNPSAGAALVLGGAGAFHVKCMVRSYLGEAGPVAALQVPSYEIPRYDLFNYLDGACVEDAPPLDTTSTGAITAIVSGIVLAVAAAPSIVTGATVATGALPTATATAAPLGSLAPLLIGQLHFVVMQSQAAVTFGDTYDAYASTCRWFNFQGLDMFQASTFGNGTNGSTALNMAVDTPGSGSSAKLGIAPSSQAAVSTSAASTSSFRSMKNNVLARGIEAFCKRLGIDPRHFFVLTLAMFSAVLAVVVIFYACMWLFVRYVILRQRPNPKFHTIFVWRLQGIVIRACYFGFYAISSSAMFQVFLQAAGTKEVRTAVLEYCVHCGVERGYLYGVCFAPSAWLIRCLLQMPCCVICISISPRILTSPNPSHTFLSTLLTLMAVTTRQGPDQ